MNLRSTTFFGICTLAVLVMLLQFSVSNFIVQSGFTALEEKQVAANLRRVQNAFADKVQQLDSFVMDWSNWDDTYAFVQDGNEQYVVSNLTTSTFAEQSLSIIALWNQRGEVVYARSVDAEGEDVPEIWAAFQSATRNVKVPSIDPAASGIGGLVVLPQGTLIFAERPVYDTDGEKPPMGGMVMARMLDAAMVREIADNLELHLEMEPVPAATLLSPGKLHELERTGGLKSYIGNTILNGYVLLRDIHGAPALVVRLTMERSIQEQGRIVARYNYVFLGLVILVYSALAYLFVRSKVIARVERLSRQIRRYEGKDLPAIRVRMEGDDEIADLAAHMNRMLAKIHDAHLEIGRQHDRIVENEQFLKQLFSSIKAGIMLIDPQSREIVEINEFGLQMIGAQSGDVTGRVCNECVCPAEKGKCPILDLHQSHDFSARTLLDKDGKAIPIMKSVSFVNRGGRELLLETFVDITELENALQALEHARNNLERQVEARTRELARANKELRAQDEAKTMFLSAASHELRTPLTSIIGFLHLMERMFGKHFAPALREAPGLEKKADTFESNLHVVHAEAQRLGRLVDDLLDLNKIESGHMQWRDKDIDTAALLRDTMEGLVGVLQDNSAIKGELSVPQDLPHIYADPDRISQVLVNLLHNALKFTEAGHVTLGAKRSRENVLFFVSDSGPGIAPQDRKRIFDIFYQGGDEDSRARSTSCSLGTGLGLAISRQIIQHYGGRIWVQSAPQKGSTFYFTLPAKR